MSFFVVAFLFWIQRAILFEISIWFSICCEYLRILQKITHFLCNTYTAFQFICLNHDSYSTTKRIQLLLLFKSISSLCTCSIWQIYLPWFFRECRTDDKFSTAFWLTYSSTYADSLIRGCQIPQNQCINTHNSNRDSSEWKRTKIQRKYICLKYECIYKLVNR